MDDIEAIKEEKEVIIIDEVKRVQEDGFLDESINTTLSAPEVRDLIADLDEFDELAANSILGSFDLTNFEGDIEISEEFEEIEHKTCELCCLQFTTISNFYRHLRSNTHKLLEAAFFAQAFKTEMPDLSSLQTRRKTIQDNPIHMNIFNNPVTSEIPIELDNDPDNDQQEIPLQFKIENDPGTDQYRIVVENLKQEDAGTAVISRPKSKGRTFKCTHCMKNFSSRSNLRRHLNLHLPKDIYKCVYCTRTFKQNEYWKKHLYTHEKYFGPLPVDMSNPL